MPVVSLHDVKDCCCTKCKEYAAKPVEYTATQEFLDEHAKMKKDIQFLLGRVKDLENREGFQFLVNAE